MKKHLLISFIAFNLLLSQANAFTPEELEQAKKSLLKPHRLKINPPIFSDRAIEAEAQRLYDVKMQELHEQEMRDLEIQLESEKQKAINYLYIHMKYEKQDAIAEVESEGFDVVAFNRNFEAERVRQSEECAAVRAEAERLAEEWAAESARLAEERAAEEARWEARREAERAADEASLEEGYAKEARWEAERAAEEARREAKRAADEARREAARAAEEAERALNQLRIQKVDALMATDMLWLDALQYVDTKPDLDVDALLKQRNEEIAARQRIEALRQMLSGYGFEDFRIYRIFEDSEFNPSDLSDLGHEKLKVLNHLMNQHHSYKQAIDCVKVSNFDAEAFLREEDEKQAAERAAEHAEWKAEEMRQAIETMRRKGLSVEEVNAVLAGEDFDAYQFNQDERDRLDEAEEIRQAIETMKNKGLSEEDVKAVLAGEDFDAYQFNQDERDRLDDEVSEEEKEWTIGYF